MQNLALVDEGWVQESQNFKI